MTQSSIPGITAIRYIPCSFLSSNIELKAIAGLPLGIFGILTEVCFSGTPTCITESEYDNHTQSEKTTLTFHSLDDLPIRNQIAFVVTDTHEQNFLIGHAEAPFPTIMAKRNFGTPAEEKAGFAYEVTLIGRKTLVKVYI